jgi:hypothetical protein
MQYRALLFCAATAVGCSARPSATSPTAPDLAERAASDGGADLLATSDALLPPPSDLALPADTLDANRDRLLTTYLAYLHAHPAAQSNGLDGSVASVCQLWSKLDGSSQAVYLTLTARMQASTLGADGTSMLSHVAKLYRLSGGQGASGSNPGSCGGGEYNRMIMSMDATLQKTLVAANAAKGQPASNGKPDLVDAPSGGNRFWRDSHDIGGPHAPFDLSDETDNGAPRGQVQYFRDPSSTVAQAPLGRMDLSSLVDPDALEMDQDYDCPHNSNPSCTYVTYGPLCAPQSAMVGVDLYTKNYGTVEPGWHPSGC